MNNKVQIYQTAGSNEYLKVIRSAYSSDRLAVLDLLMSKALYENHLDDRTIAGVKSHHIERPPFETELTWDLQKVASVVCAGSDVKRSDMQRRQWIQHFLECCNDFIRKQTLLVDARLDVYGRHKFILDLSLARSIIPDLTGPAPLSAPAEMYRLHRGHGQRECNAFLANRLMLVDRKMNASSRPDSVPLSWPELSHITTLPGPEAWRRDGYSTQRRWSSAWFLKAVRKPLEAYGLFMVRRVHDDFYVKSCEVL